jgi:hypothetical protein
LVGNVCNKTGQTRGQPSVNDGKNSLMASNTLSVEIQKAATKVMLFESADGR